MQNVQRQPVSEAARPSGSPPSPQDPQQARRLQIEARNRATLLRLCRQEVKEEAEGKSQR
jgi:hypothetical protein